MNKLLSKLMDLYLLVVYITLILTIVISVDIIRYTRDINHKDAFKIITCDHIFYDKNNIERNKDWYCEINESEYYPIAITGSMWPKIADFESNKVWLNKDTGRAYKYVNEESVLLCIQQRIIYSYVFLIALVMVSCFLLYKS